MKKLLWAGIFSFITTVTHGGAITVGGFLDRMPKTAGIARLKLDPDKLLTEGDMVAISVAAGIAVTTQAPERVVTERQVETYFAAFHDQLQGRNSRQRGPHHDKGKHKGKNKSPHSPDDL